MSASLMRQEHRGASLRLRSARMFLSAVCLAFCLWAEYRLRAVLAVPVIPGWLTGADLFLFGCLLLMKFVQLPLRISTDWQLGRLNGTLDAADLGFLRLSNPLWLWARAAAVQTLCGMLLLAAWIPALLLFAAANTLQLQIPPDSESLLPLLGVLHLYLLSAAAVWFPFRMFKTAHALPVCFLKNPHKSAFFVLRSAVRASRKRT